MAESGDVEMVQLNYDPALRNAEFSKICHLFKFLYKKFTQNDFSIAVGGTIDLDVSNDIAGIFYTLYTYLRKEANPNAGSRGNMNELKQAKMGTIVCTIVDLAKEYKAVAGYSQFEFKICTPIMDNLTTFKCMWSEIRMSCGKFDLRINGRKTTKRLADFGLDNTAIPYLTGITFKPKRRTGLMKTLGPVALSLLLANETRYTDKIERALEEQLRTYSFCSSLIESLKGIKIAHEGGEIFKALSMILMMAGARQHNKIHVPIMFFVAMRELDDTFDANWSFSGLKAMLLYVKWATQFIWAKKSGGKAEEIAQVVFHAMFGTAIEDLSILSQSTYCNDWLKRNDLNAVFLEQSRKPSVQFTPILWIKACKLAQASMVSHAQSSNVQNNCRIVLAGKRKRTFDSAFEKFLEMGTQGTNFSTNPTTLAYQLIELKEKMLLDLKAHKFDSAGTVDWYKVSDGKWISDPDFIPKEARSYFYC